MNPDVFITIAFAGIVVFGALVALLVVAPQARRETARIAHAESRRPERSRRTAKPGTRAAIH